MTWPHHLHKPTLLKDGLGVSQILITILIATKLLLMEFSVVQGNNAEEWKIVSAEEKYLIDDFI